MTYTVNDPPHLRTQETARRMMWRASAALLPAVVLLIIFSSLPFLKLLTTAVLSALTAEVLGRWIFKNPGAGNLDGASFYTGVLAALLLPPSAPAWTAGLAGFAGVFLGKEVFGGWGSHLFHPALVGAALARMLSPSAGTEALAGAPPALLVAAFFAGGLWLIFRGQLDWTLPGIYLATVAAFALRGGGLSPLPFGIFAAAAFFLAGDPATTPLKPSGRRLYALLAAFTASLFRLRMPETDAVIFSFLLMNAFTPWLDRLSLPRKREKKG